MVDEALPPERIAEIVVDAMAAGRFYIFPQPERKNDIRARLEDILEGKAPVFPEPAR